jgi:hypothetical protein
MRTELRKREGSRETFTGRFVRYGWKDGWVGRVRTLLLVDVRDAEGLLVADHLWFNCTKGFEQAGLVEGCVVQFDARVMAYKKGYRGHVWERALEAPRPSTDYHLTRPTRVAVLSEQVA